MNQDLLTQIPMANFHQSEGHPPQITRAITDQEMNLYAEKLKKRKFFTEETEESSLPAAKHKCHESTITSEENSSLTNSRIDENASCDMDTQVESGQDSNSFPDDSQFCPKKRDSHEEIEAASTCCSNSAKGYFYSESGFEDDADSLGECISEKDEQKADGGLEEFLSCSGMNPNLYLLSGERWSADQEAQKGRQKPTIDQEFEQFFSTLML